MSKLQQISRDGKRSLIETFGPTVRTHANVITGFIALIIVVAGVGALNGREGWYLSTAALITVFLAVMLYLSARVVIKAFAAVLFVVFMANFALQGGLLFSPSTSVGLIWMSAQVFLFLACVCLSYLITGHRSRWTGAALANFIAFMTAAGLSAATSLLAAICAAMLVGLAVFFAYYRGSGVLMEQTKRMPANVGDEELGERLAQQAELEGWSVRLMNTRTLIRRRVYIDYLVWNDEHAYVLHPVKLETKLSISPGRKGSKLVHRGASINPWLLNLVNKRLPLWRSRNASMMLVLLDVDSKNGIKPEAIGVSLPDTQKKLPVGIYPAKALFSANSSKKAKGSFADIDRVYGAYLEPLTAKQRDAMEEIGMESASEYISESEESNASA